MSVLESPPQPGDNLDGLLRAFLRSQLPQPWPPLPAFVARSMATRRPATGRNLMRSRWALAASIALLLCGSWLLPSRFTSDAKLEHGAGGPLIGSNDLRRDFHKDNKDNKDKSGANKNNPGLAADEDDQLPEWDGSDVPLFK